MKKKPVRKLSRAKKPPARQIVMPRHRPGDGLDPAENRRRAELGDLRDSKAAELLGLLRQVARPDCKPATAGLLSQQVRELLRAKDGDTLRDLAHLVERPIARHAEEIAFGIEARMAKLAAEAANAKAPPRRKRIVPQLPPLKRAAIIESIRKETNCSERTAAAAVDKTSLAQLLGWKAGRPRD
jgi:hypothetical protein